MEEQVAYSQDQFIKKKKEYMLSTALDFPGDRVIAVFWHWRSQVFPKGCYHYDLEVFCETVYNSILYRKYKVNMDLILLKL